MKDQPDLFDDAVNYIFRNEGGFTYDYDDPGGATNFGITLTTLREWRNIKLLSAEDVRRLTKDEARKIYYQNYWRPLRGPDINSLPVATAILDVGVLFGPGISGVYAQKTLKASGYTVTVDGKIGPETIAALNLVDSATFIKMLTNLLLVKIDEVVDAHPPSEKFRKGWENRLNRLSTLLV